MPVPKTENVEGPRTLLRDVVYGKMHAAIEDGTLEPGERLNDDELTTWLGVSRTPIREAIALLVSDGLVEMSANRYTRVAVADPAAYLEASDFLLGFHRIIVDRAMSLDGSVRSDIAKRARSLEPLVRHEDKAALADAFDLFGEATKQLGNRLLSTTEQQVRGRAKFHLKSADAAVDWKAHLGTLHSLAADN